MVHEIPGVDLAVLMEWMDQLSLGDGPLTGVELITGGTQNILLRFGRADRTYVLRRPPVNKRANSDETMRREARVLAALSGSAVPHPGLIAAEPDPEVLGAAFYLTSSLYISGRFNFGLTDITDDSVDRDLSQTDAAGKAVFRKKFDRSTGFQASIGFSF